MDIFGLLIAFIFGVVCQMFSDVIAKWFFRIAPIQLTRWFYVFSINPRLYFKTLRNTPERNIKQLIEKLFHAWETKDHNLYLSCWLEDATRIVGDISNAEERKSQIRRKFLDSCQRYSKIHVESLIFERINILEQGDGAIVEVRYRFNLIRAKDQLPIIEDAKEIYSVLRRDDAWMIKANYDHFLIIGDGMAS